MAEQVFLKVLKARCNNCERSYREHGKLCPWRSISGDYCFDGMNTEEAHREIKKNKEMLSILPKENIEGVYEITEKAEEFIREAEK